MNKELTIEKMGLTKCKDCEFFFEKYEGQYRAAGCAHLETPILESTMNEEVLKKFKDFACPYGRPRTEGKNTEGIA